MPLAGDPLDWSVDEVVDALCRSTDWWKEGRSNSILPDPNTFETILRDEEINGYALLTYLTDQTLKEEFGIKTIGRRTTVLWAIDKLREQSPKYAERLAAQRSIFTALVPPHALDGQVKTASTRRQKKFPVDLIFYGDATFGQVLEDDDDLEFQHHGEVPAAMGSYVYRQFFHFIRSSERKELPQDGKKIVAIHPYRSTILPSNHPRSATVIEADSHSARATRQDALRLHGSIPFDSSIPYKDNDHHEWYSLAEKWSKDDDKVLPALGDSDEEEYSSSFEAELEAEERERALEEFRREQPRLSKEEVSAIIQERIEELVDIWKREVWHKKVEVLKQCATLEESVSQREEELWRMSIWDLKVEPARASAPTAPRRPSNKRAKTDGKDLGEEAGDWVNSDSETESDGLEDFVEIDQDIKETTPEQSPAPLAPDSLDEVSDLDPALDVVSMTGASREEDSGGIGAQDIDIDLMDGPATGLDPDLSPTTPKHARIPKPESAPRSAHSVIDLTALSDGSEPLSPTPFLRPAMSKPSVTPGSQISGPRYGGDPEQSTIAEIMTWTVDELQERSDKKRLVLKILRTNMSAKEYKQMRRHVTSVTIKTLRDHLRQAMEAICCGGRPPGTEDKEWDILVGLARLYGCWSKVRFKYWQMKLEKYASILAKLLKTLDTAGSKRELDVFFTFVVRILKKFPSQKSDSVSVVEKERIFQERISSSQSNSDRLIVNPGEFGKDGAIYIHPSIGSRIKTHQVEGVKFMWRELVEAGHTDPQGCLLAHTMGLGKTMQTITLLVTIAEAAGSPDEHVRSQIPQELRRMQVLILCPASLVNNWLDELHEWIPESTSKKIGVIREINAEIAIDKRLQRIHKWHRKGGILVMSYEMLRTLLSEKQPSKFSEEERGTIERRLLDGPSIIIADEAHRLKTSNSSLRHIVERFESKSRVALTGSPLANNLVEYWSMIDWISPGFLGSQKEFRAHFVEPIEEGLYKDSSPYEHRKALKKLRVLKSEIGPKINRADITVLKDDLKPKVEFLITVPLTDLQERLYKLCVQNLTAKRKDKVSNSRIWQWIHVLTMLCNHPAAFLKRLKNMQLHSEKPNQVAVEESESTDQPDLSMDDQGTLDPQADLSPDFIEQAISLFDVAQNPESPHHSFKTEILMGILETAREADDQVLVFSQHIPTLDYLENLLRKEKHRFIRLDGKTKMAHRPELLEKFNKGDFDVFLISTRAGGTGFNMPGANRVVIFDFGFNPQNEEQAIGRAYRIGQKKEVFVYRMLAGGTFEPKVWNKALFKTQLASRVVDTKNPERHAEKMRDYFFDPKPVEQQDLAEHQGKDKRVLDKILAKRDQGQDPGIRAITTTETLMTEDLDAALNEQEKEEVKKMIEAERLPIAVGHMAPSKEFYFRKLLTGTELLRYLLSHHLNQC
ncbi:SNF2-related protein [Neofusicoccum parvum]|uniref:SNF2-related protein n=1 Tax=Neofusicoccum parvum TaxID=310453 RepID=A0ACB5SF87_9PEZI|nr:SNF2-related protein [Neofusicoccum parvum]